MEPSSLVFEPNEEFKNISIYTTIEIGQSPSRFCPLIAFIGGTDVVAPEACKKCLEGATFSKNTPWILSIERKHFDGGPEEVMFIRMKVVPSIDYWRTEYHQVMVNMFRLNFLSFSCQ